MTGGVVVGTAGHIDHGKTTLLRALTGIDADRLPEERRRGMTIDVGYAHLALPDGGELDFVDVPGHDRLVGNMLVGVGEVDAALLVVAADDGPRAQTVEHLELLDGLGVTDGVAVVTKVDAVGSVRRGEAADAVRRLLDRTTLAGVPLITVSSVSGEGLEELRVALAGLRDRVRSRPGFGAGPTRLAIDRAFAVRGRGVVVTGSLRGGAIERGSLLRLDPDGRTVRVREVQIHGRTVERVEGGGRVALNLGGVELDDLRRGLVLSDGPAIEPGDRLLVALRRPARLGAGDLGADPGGEALRDGARLRLHLGTDHVDATLDLGQRAAAALPDGETTAILRLERAVATAFGDRFVLRRPSPGATAAGGRVLDPLPPRGVSRRRATGEAHAALGGAAERERLAALVALHGAVPVVRARAFAAANGWPDPAAPPAGTRLTGPFLLDERIAAALEASALAAVAERAEAEPLAGGLPLAALRTRLARDLRRAATVDRAAAAAVAAAIVAALADAGRLVRDGDRVREAGRATGLPPDVLAAMDRLEAALAVSTPPPLADAARTARCPAEGIRALEAAGRIVRLETDLAYAARIYREFEALALRLARAGPLSPAAFRDATGTSRRYALAVLEDLDRRGVLRRTPDGHVPGPRAATGATVRTTSGGTR